MSIKLYQIQDFLRIPYKVAIGDPDCNLSLIVENPVSLNISKMPPPYSHQDFERGVWKPVIHFHLNYDIGLENLTLCRFRDRICESKVSFRGNNAEIVNGSAALYLSLLAIGDLENIDMILRRNFPPAFQHAFERAQGSALINYLRTAITSLESLAHAQESAYLLRQNSQKLEN